MANEVVQIILKAKDEATQRIRVVNGELGALTKFSSKVLGTVGPFGVAAFYAAEAVEVTGEATVYSRPSDTGFDVVHRFCPACGSTVWWEATRKPGLVAVALGAFADPEFPGPSQSVRAETRHRWLPEGFP